MPKNTLDHYLADLGFLLKQAALDAKAHVEKQAAEQVTSLRLVEHMRITRFFR